MANSEHTLSPRTPRITFLWPLLFLAGVSSVFVSFSLFHAPSSQIDFVQYAAAYRAMLDHLNPYDPTTMLRYEQALGFVSEKPMMFWAPPWTITILTPIFAFSGYAESLLSWRLASIALTFLCLCLLVKDFRVPLRGGACITLVMILNAPFLHSLKVGQCTALLISGVSLITYYLRRRMFWWIGFCSVLITIKPHLFIVAAIPIFLVQSRKDQYQILSGFFTAYVPLMIVTEFSFPGAIGNWLTVTLGGSTAGSVIDRSQWLCGTFLCLIRTGLHPAQGALISVACVGSAVAYIYIVMRRHRDVMRDFLWVLPLSLLLAPYGWFFDFAVLMPVLIVMVLNISLQKEGRSAGLLYIYLLVFSLISVSVFAGTAVSHSEVWWYPLGILGGAALCQRAQQSMKAR